MSVRPNPPGPTLQVRLVYALSDGEGGNRFYVTFTGSRPTGTQCASIASAIATAWGTDLQPMCSGNTALIEVDVLDITDNMGASGQAIVSLDGSRSGTGLLTQAAVNTEYDIGRRYRGGKPRVYFPGGVETDLLNQSQFSSSFVTAMNTAWSNFFTAVTSITEGSTVLAEHVNLSFYHGFTNVTNTSGRTRAAPTYRAPGTVVADNVVGYATKVKVSSQRRRREATTP
jgi:hypothetical protein